MEGSTRNITPLTADEIGRLEGQGEKLLQILAQLDSALYDNTIEMTVALAAFGECRLTLDQLKAERSALIERARMLKVILGSFPNTGGPTWVNSKK